MFTLRFDMRAPVFGAPIGDLYTATIEMCAWAEDRGALVAVLSEHHGTEDCHLPSPIVLASAIVARTTRLPILLAALVLPFYDPVRLAEDMSILDIIGSGRVAYVLGIGHHTDEYEHFGLEVGRRGELADKNLALLIRLLDGRTNVEDGRRTHVTPSTSGPTKPRLLIGGGSIAAAKRAGHFGLDLLTHADAPGLTAAYETACLESRHEVGQITLPDPTAPTAVFVADDLDAAWEELGPHLLHDAVTAASYRHRDDAVASISKARTVEELRALEGPYRILTPHQASEYVAVRGGYCHCCHCALARRLAWPYLERAVAAVDRADRESGEREST